MKLLQAIPVGVFLLLALTSNSFAHGGHEQITIAADADWATRHMAGQFAIAFLNSLIYILSILQRSITSHPSTPAFSSHCTTTTALATGLLTMFGARTA